ncbi:MAG TPA: hypothetical protein VGX23_08470 [Actinocrinis sp.]|nr:hypothetical protein [Actinocrinis sp.]
MAALNGQNIGPAMDSFNQYWDGIGGVPYNCAPAGDHAMLTILMEACNALATGCSDFADAVDEEKKKLEETATEIGAAVLAGTAATMVTLGLSDVAAGTATSTLAAAGVAGVEVLGTTIEEIAGVMVNGLVFGVLDDMMDTGLNDGIKIQIGEPVPSAVSGLEGLALSGLVGSLTFGISDRATDAVKLSSLAGLTALPDSVSTMLPDLPAILGTMPGAAESAAGQALLKLSSEYAVNSAADKIEGKPTEVPTLSEILGELLDSKIEGTGADEEK